MSTRKAIRSAVRDLLAAQPALTGRVYASRGAALDEQRLPAVLVYTERETSENIADIVERRTLDLVIKVVVRNAVEGGADDELDDLCDLVERAITAAMSGWMSPKPELATLCEDISYDSTSLEYRGEDGRQNFLSADMVFKAVYAGGTDADFADLTLVSVGIDMASPRNDPPIPPGPDGQIDARTDIVLPI